MVIIGSGFGGLFAAQALRKAPVDVTIIAKTGYHLFQPLLYQVATGILSEGEIAPATREILRKQKNALVLLGEVTDIDLAARTVTSSVLGRTTVLPYDELIVAAGAGQSYFGNDRFAEFAPGMKSVDDALELRGRIFGAFELAELAEDQAEIDRLLTFVVVGAGPTGVEMAGQIAELARRTLRRDFRRIDPTTARVVLLDAAPYVLPSFGEKLGGRARRQLNQIGVEVQLGAMVTDVDADGIEVKDADGQVRRIHAATKIWAAGVQASPLGRMLGEQSGAEVDRAGRVAVLPDLTLPGHPEVHVVGDMMALDKLPGVAQVAIQGGRYAADQIKRRHRRQGAARAVPVPRQGLDGDDLAVPRRRRPRQAEVRGLHRLADVAGPPPLLHRRLQEPDHHRAALAGQLHGPRALPAGRHPAAGLRPAGARAPRAPTSRRPRPAALRTSAPVDEDDDRARVRLTQPSAARTTPRDDPARRPPAGRRCAARSAAAARPTCPARTAAPPAR